MLQKLLGAVVGLVVAGMAATANAVTYSIFELTPLGGTTSGASGLNENGQVVGTSQISGDIASHATYWDTNNGAATPTDLGTLGATSSSAFDINNLSYS